ncbi:MAG: cytochrome c oxidase subunit II [Myxococcales bacterium]|nr:cytochrome c oxidase subunit II [Myxococcales bacterium]
MAATAAAAVAESQHAGTFWFPPQASTVAAASDRLWYAIYWLSVAGFIGVVIALAFFLVRYRNKGVRPAEDQTSHNTTLELTWTILPVFLVIAMFWFGLTGYIDMRTPPRGAYEIGVTGVKWNWTFTYPNGLKTKDLHVPVDRPVRLVMTSEDVIHSFFVPAFRVKMDVVPGRYNDMWFEATTPGNYRFTCTEYCGAKHWDMMGNVVVHERGGFESWLDQEESQLAGASPVEKGGKLFQTLGCVACHSVDGSPGLAPTLKAAFGRQESLTDGSKIVIDENYIRESVVNPAAKVVAGFNPIMPAYQGRVSDEDLTAIIQYIKSLSKG